MTPSNFAGDEDVEYQFESVPPKEGGIGIGVGTLFDEARARGWRGQTRDAKHVFKGALERARAELSASTDPVQLASSPSRFALRDPEADARRPPITYRDQAKLWMNNAGGAITQLYAAPKCHKSNLILAELFRLMLWAHARVLIMPLEGQYGVTTARIPALVEYYGARLDELRGKQSRFEYLLGRFQVVDAPGFSLSDPECVLEFIRWANEEGDKAGLGGWTDIFIDTQHRAAGTLEENSATDARILWNAVESIKRGVTHE